MGFIEIKKCKNKIFRYDSSNKMLFVFNEDMNSEDRIICSSCLESEQFIIEGILKKCIKCNALYI